MPSSKLYSQKAVPKLSSVTLLDPHIYDPSTRSESSSRKSKSVESLYSSTSTKTSSSAEWTSSHSENSICKSANKNPSIDRSKTNENFYSVSHLQEKEANGKSTAAADKSANQYLDADDLFTAKKLLGKLCKTMVESTCHHGKKGQQLNANLDKLQKALVDNTSVVNDFVTDFDLKNADAAGAMIERIDPQMTALQELSRFSSALTSLEEWLDLTEADNQRVLDTIERAKQNLQKQKELEKVVKYLEEQSVKHRAIFNAVELNDPALLGRAIAAAEKKSSIRRKRYGVKEKKHFIPEFMAVIKDFEDNLSEMKRFFLPAGLLHRKYFNKMEALLENVKNEISEHFAPLSAASSMASLFSPASENPIAYSTCDYFYAPSADEHELEIEVSRSDTNYSNSEPSLALSLESTQSSCYDTVESTQASSFSCDTTQASSSNSCDTVCATQPSVSNDPIGESSVTTCPSFELECDITQSSGASMKTAISPQSASLKTALSGHDVLSTDSMGSSSTIAI